MSNVEESESTLNFIKLRSWKCAGLTPAPVTIEVLRTKGLCQLALTGLPDAWLKDSRDKMRAVVASHAPWGPLERILVHLLPADESKNGAHLEFPIVAGCLAVLWPKKLPPGALELFEAYQLVGSINLEGKLISTEASATLEDDDPDHIIGPSRFDSIAEFLDYVMTRAPGAPLPPRRAGEAPRREPAPTEIGGDDETLEGHVLAKLLLSAAALLKRPALLLGPPGVGKSRLARWAARGLPETHAQDAKRIWRLNGADLAPAPLVVAPHARAHIAEFLGSFRRGVSRPGYFALAHGGTLLLDELPEFNRDCREILRTVLDQKKLIRTGHGEGIVWPSDFWLVATANPCPCGFAFLAERSRCVCSRTRLEQYVSRFSGPLLDRFAVKLFVKAPRQPALRAENERLAQMGLAALVDRTGEERSRWIASARDRAAELRVPWMRRLSESETSAQWSPRTVALKAELGAAIEALTPLDAGWITALLNWTASVERNLLRSPPPSWEASA